MQTEHYNFKHGIVNCKGLAIPAGAAFDDFLKNEVSSRLYDSEGKAEFILHLNSLASTGFAQESLKDILESETIEERDWAICEALAEAWLSKHHGVAWPWNMERDKRTPKASLPGADLIGFATVNDKTFLVLGEVKSSSDLKTPPNVMYGRSGITHQLETLVTDGSIQISVLRWLQARCKQGDSEKHFNDAVSQFLGSGNKAMLLFGVLVRDTAPNYLDVDSRGKHLSGILDVPTQCNLVALYLPCLVNSLPSCFAKGAGST